MKQVVQELGSGDREGSAADCRQFDWRHNKIQQNAALVDQEDQRLRIVDVGTVLQIQDSGSRHIGFVVKC